jgi:hypothetical protein
MPVVQIYGEMFMDVIIDGKAVLRQVDYFCTVESKHIPKLKNNEFIVWIVGSAVPRIFKR